MWGTGFANSFSFPGLVGGGCACAASLSSAVPGYQSTPGVACTASALIAGCIEDPAVAGVSMTQWRGSKLCFQVILNLRSADL